MTTQPGDDDPMTREFGISSVLYQESKKNIGNEDVPIESIHEMFKVDIRTADNLDILSEFDMVELFNNYVHISHIRYQ